MRWEGFSEIGRFILIVGLLILIVVTCVEMVICEFELLLDRGSTLSAKEMRACLQEREEIVLKGSQLAMDEYRAIYIEDKKVGYARLEMSSFFEANVYVYTVNHELVSYFESVQNQLLFQGLNEAGLVSGYVLEDEENYVFYSPNLEVIATSESKEPRQIQNLSGACLFEVQYRYNFWRNEQQYEIKRGEDSELDLMFVIWMIFRMEVE